MCRTVDNIEILIAEGLEFGTIYADPPWQYGNQSTRSSTDKHYKTLSIQEITDYPIRELTADNCHLHIWTTNAFIFECPKIIEAWGFVYKSMFVWTKSQMGIGNYWRVSHEILLTAIKPGSFVFEDHCEKSWIQTDRGRHSSKPEIVAEKIERVSPGPYLELFGRKERPGWTVFGNQIDKQINLFGGINETRLQNQND